MASQPDFNSDTYESVELAFEFIVPSYDWAMRRLEAAERRIDNLMRFIITVTLALGASAIAIAELSSQPLSLFLDCVAIIALASFLITFLIAIVLGMWVRQTGNITLLSPSGLYHDYIQKTKREFQGLILFHAGKHLEKNEELVRRKSNAATVMVVLFLFELCAAAIWFHSLTTQ